MVQALETADVVVQVLEFDDVVQALETDDDVVQTVEDDGVAPVFESDGVVVQALETDDDVKQVPEDDNTAVRLLGFGGTALVLEAVCNLVQKRERLVSLVPQLVDAHYIALPVRVEIGNPKVGEAHLVEAHFVQSTVDMTAH